MSTHRLTFPLIKECTENNSLITVKLDSKGAKILNSLESRVRECCAYLCVPYFNTVYSKGGTWTTKGDILYDFIIQFGFDCFNVYCKVE